MHEPVDASSWHPTARAVLAEWAADPGDHQHLADFTRVGYGAGRPLPVDQHARVIDVADHGARGDDATDCADAFDAAIAAAGEGATIRIPAGRFVLGRPIVVARSDVAIVGAGSDRTILRFPRPLTQSFRDGADGDQSVYSWSGGQVWFAPREYLDAFPSRGAEHWRGQPGTSRRVRQDARRGTRRLLLEHVEGLRAGDWLLLTLDADRALLRAMCGDVPGADAFDWECAVRLLPGPSQRPEWAAYRSPIRIADVETVGSAIVLDDGLRVPVRSTWAPRVAALASWVHDVGIAGVTIENAELPRTAHNRHPGSNGVAFARVIDGWARDVVVRHVDVGFSITASRRVTLHDTAVRGRAAHHPYACRVGSHDTMVEHFAIDAPPQAPARDAPTHGINVEGYSSGNVWRRGTMHAGTFDSHRAVPFDVLRTAIETRNVGSVGGSGEAGPNYGARVAHWGIEVVGGRSGAVLVDDAAPSSIVLGVRGASGPSGAAAPIPADRRSVRHLLDDRVAPIDAYEAQRILVGLPAEPTPRDR